MTTKKVIPMNKSSLTGAAIKKALKANRCMYRGHNKNKTGGNFGINIYFAEGFNRATDREITGAYDTTGKVRLLKYGPLYSVGINMQPENFETFEAMLDKIKEIETKGWLR